MVVVLDFFLMMKSEGLAYLSFMRGSEFYF